MARRLATMMPGRSDEHEGRTGKERMGDERLTVDIRITGHVQGVGFRVSARRRAAQLGLTGTAENREDGSVLVRMSGPRDAIDAMIAWCRHGPPAARVTGVEVDGRPAGR
jgi:acylphosphatase